MKFGFYFILLAILTMNANIVHPQSENSESMNYAIAISNISILPQMKEDHSQFNTNATSSQIVNFQFTISHWNPKPDEQWIAFSDYYDRVGFAMQLDSMAYNHNPNLEIVPIQISAAAFKVEAFQSGISNITYLSDHMFFFDVLNYSNDSLPFGIYRFDHHSIMMCSNYMIGDCDNDKEIMYYGVTVESTENEITIKYDTLPDKWGEINSDQDTGLLNNFSSYIFSISLFVLYSIRKK